MEFASHLVRMRSSPGSATEPYDHSPHYYFHHHHFPADEAALDLRRAITAEAMALVAQKIASAKMRHEPIPFPASLEVQQRAAAVFESPQSVDATSMPNPSVNT